jgi:hypothetical protein
MTVASLWGDSKVHHTNWSYTKRQDGKICGGRNGGEVPARSRLGSLAGRPRGGHGLAGAPDLALMSFAHIRPENRCLANHRQQVLALLQVNLRPGGLCPEMRIFRSEIATTLCCSRPVDQSVPRALVTRAKGYCQDSSDATRSRATGRYAHAPAAALLTGLGAGERSPLRSRPCAVFHFVDC